MFETVVEHTLAYGYTEPSYRWTCPLCTHYHIVDNLDPDWVVARVETHLRGYHDVALSRLAIVYKDLDAEELPSFSHVCEEKDCKGEREDRGLLKWLRKWFYR